MVDPIVDDLVVGSAPATTAGGEFVNLQLDLRDSSRVRFVIDGAEALVWPLIPPGSTLRIALQAHDYGGDPTGHVVADSVKVVRSSI